MPEKMRETHLLETRGQPPETPGPETFDAGGHKPAHPSPGDAEAYRFLMERSSDLIFILNRRGQIVFGNNSAMTSFGYSRQEIIGASIARFLTRDSVKKAFFALAQEFLGRPQPKLELEVKSKSGEIRLISVAESSAPIHQDGKMVGIMVTARDITEERRAKLELERSERQYRDLVEKSGIAIVTDDREGNITYFNRRFAEIFGYTAEEMRKKTTWMCVHPNDTEKLRSCHCARVRGKPAPSRYEIRGIRKDGSTIYLEVDAVAVEGGGRLVGTHSYMWDISDRKAVEEKRRESDERFRSIVENSHDAIAIIDDNFRIIYANPESARISGYGQEEIIGRNFTGVFADESKKFVSDLYIRRQKGEPVPSHYEHDMIRKSGEKRRIEISSSVIRNSARKAETLAQFRDITERKRAEEELKLKGQLLDSAHDSIFAIDHEGNFIYVNEAAYKSRGYDRDELMGMNLRELDDPKYAPFVSKRIQEIMEKGSAVFESAHLHKDGSSIPVEVHARLFEQDGRKIILSIISDITKRKQADSELKSTLANLRRIVGATVQAIASAVEARDPYTAGHQRRVADLARSIAKEMGLPQDKIQGIRTAGVIHDLGKLSIPSEILSKPARLSDIEFSLIKTHAEQGYAILKDISFPWPVARIVREHHERMDGSGYPQGLKDDEILIESRILAVADVVEAIASHRPYRPSKGIGAALEEIQTRRAGAYDPDAVDACLRVFEKGYRFPEL